MAAFNYFLGTLIIMNALSARSYADDIDASVRDGSLLKVLRQMVNQTKADSLNLPANATSIRENITDTFSCENRTYGYYADVDNECQVFHVCMPSQNRYGRSIAYRWSFICPNETIFNQAVMTCTRPRDSIYCEDSPLYYDLNMDIGKLDETAPNEQQIEQQAQYEQQMPTNMKIIGVKSQKRKPTRRKNNLVVENIRDIVNGELMKHNLEAIFKEEEELMPLTEEIIFNEETSDNESKVTENKSELHENKAQKMKMKINNKDEKIKKSEDKNLKRRGRKIVRGSFRFKADA